MSPIKSTLTPLMATGRDDWGTPRDFFHALHQRFGFDVDLCATANNACLLNYITPEEDSLRVPWTSYGRVGWCNPPFGRPARRFVDKALQERTHGFTTVLLLPARTDTALFHECLWDRQTHHPRTGVQIEFLKGRLTFDGATAPAPFPCLLAIVWGSRD